MKTKENNLCMLYDADAEKVVDWFPKEDLHAQMKQAKKFCHKVRRVGNDILMFGFQNSSMKAHGQT